MSLVLIKDPACIQKKEIFELNPSKMLIDELIRVIGPDGFDAKATLYKGSISPYCEVWKKNESDDIDHPDNIALKTFVGDDDYFIVCEPNGFDPITAIVIGVALNVASAVIFKPPTPSVEQKQQNQSQSPNNSVTSQQNSARLLQSRPRIIGSDKSFPDRLTRNPRVFYENNIKQIEEYLCVSEDELFLTEIKSGETLISDIPDSQVDFYIPGQRPSELIVQFISESVQAADLNPPNFRPIDISSCEYTYDSGTDRGTVTLVGAGFNDDIDPGDALELAMTSISDGGGGFTDLNGIYQVFSVTQDNVVLTGANAINSSWGTFVDTNTVPNVSSGAEARLQSDPKPVGPFDIVRPETTEDVQLDFAFPRGLVRDYDQSITVDIRADLEVFFSGGGSQSFSAPYSFTANRQVELFFTRVINIASNVTIPSGQTITRITTSVVRTSDTDYDDPTRLDLCQWIGYSSLRDDIDNYEFTETTRLLVKIAANDQIATQSNQRINCIATQVGFTYVPSTGNLDGPRGPITDMLNCILNYMVVDAGIPYESLRDGAAQLYQIQNTYPYDASRRLQLGATLDGTSVTYRDNIGILTNACRVFAFVDYTGLWSFKRDQDQDSFSALFNRRNKKPDSENLAYNPYRVELNDGVELTFKDRDNDYESTTIIIPDDDPTFTTPNATNPSTINAIGIVTKEQAWDRARLEYAKILYQRISLQGTVTSDGLLVEMNDRVHYDFEDLTRQDGEVLGFNGLTVDTSNECIFEPGKTYTVILRDDEGNPSNYIPVTGRTDTTFGFVLSTQPSFSLFTRGDNDYQRGSLYSFVEVGSTMFNDWLVQDVAPDENNNCELKMVNYDSRVYSKDGVNPPTGA